jgi:hypothetical protein
MKSGRVDLSSVDVQFLGLNHKKKHRPLLSTPYHDVEPGSHTCGSMAQKAGDEFLRIVTSAIPILSLSRQVRKSAANVRVDPT